MTLISRHQGNNTVIMADCDTLMEQVRRELTLHLDHFMMALDERFGQGTAAAHPVLVVKLALCATEQSNLSCLGKALESAVMTHGDRIADAIRDHGQSLESVADAISQPAKVKEASSEQQTEKSLQ